ncbi:MAG: hypothetical protein ACPIA7_07460 [Akkermansiaceae bacterium]
MTIRQFLKYAAAISCVVFTIATTTHQASAQLVVRLELSKSSYIVNEPIKATVYLTNNAGREVTLSEKHGRPWLDFIITARGRGVTPSKPTNYGAIILAAGETVARSVTLNSSYALETMGNYMCQVYIQMPEAGRNGFVSNRVSFNVMKGRVMWNQRVGIPGAPDEIREYELLSFTGNRSMELFAHVTSVNRKQEIATIPLGKIISFRKPTGMLDGANNMHALYQLRPDMFGHSCVTPSGILQFTKFHKRGATGDPRLTRFANGEVLVAGSVLFDPVAEEAQRKKVRNASERPPFIYN